MNLKDKLNDSESIVGAWLSIGHPAVARITAREGFDFVLIDTEQPLLGLGTIENMSRSVDAADGTTQTVVRVPSNDAGGIKRVLDLGVSGVLVPMVETAADAESTVAAVRYPPSGTRGVASGRATEHGDEPTDYAGSVNSPISVIAQIETAAGLSNIDEIAAVEGIDAVFVGRADLPPTRDISGGRDSELSPDAIETAIEAGDRTDVPVGTLVVTPDDIKRRVRQGFDYLIAGKDTSHLSAANETVRKRYEEAIR